VLPIGTSLTLSNFGIPKSDGDRENDEKKVLLSLYTTREDNYALAKSSRKGFIYPSCKEFPHYGLVSVTFE
jgi:hypothetical protein